MLMGLALQLILQTVIHILLHFAVQPVLMAEAVQLLLMG